MKLRLITAAILFAIILTQAISTNAENTYYENQSNTELKNLPSQWAEKSIADAIELGIVPEELQASYTQNISRAEFCRLAIQTYAKKTGNNIDLSIETPFCDIDDPYVTTAYNLNIISGVGGNKFAPNNYLTRQEAAVILNNLAAVLCVKTENSNPPKFIDENYFADWAKTAIYTVTNTKSGDTYIMAGTGSGKFSPWMNYTREQAIATMLRLFECTSSKDSNNDLTYRIDKNNDTNLFSLISSDGKKIVEKAAFIRPINFNRFYIGVNNDNSFYNGFNCDNYSLIDISGNYIINKTNNYLIYIGYGKFVELENNDSIINSSKYTVYDINGQKLDLKYHHIDINSNTGITDKFYSAINDETNCNDNIISAVNLDLITSDENIFYTQFDWNITREQLGDFIMNLYRKISDNADNIDIVKTFDDTNNDNINKLYNIGVLSPKEHNNFHPYENITYKEAKEIFLNFSKLTDLEEYLPDAFETNYSEYYTVEQATLTIYNLYNFSKSRNNNMQ